MAVAASAEDTRHGVSIKFKSHDGAINLTYEIWDRIDNTGNDERRFIVHQSPSSKNRYIYRMLECAISRSSKAGLIFLLRDAWAQRQRMIGKDTYWLIISDMTH